MALLCVGHRLRVDRQVVRQVVLEAVKQNGDVLKFVGYKLRNDREVVLAAVQQDWTSIQYASSELRKDSDLVRVAMLSKSRCC